MECLSYCVANTVDLSRLDNFFKSTLPEFLTTKSRDVLKLVCAASVQRVIFVFKNGTVVTWGYKRHQVAKYLSIVQRFSDKPVNFPVHDEFSYQVDDNTSIGPHGFFDVDCLAIQEETDDFKLGLSYGFSQSVKLQYFETIIETLIEKYTPLIQKLSNKKQPSINRSQIRTIIGEILGAKSEMNLISNFLYHPKYFWRHPTLEEHFIMLERYLHIQRRVNAINHRLDTLNEIFDMFNSYLENRHAHHLEIIIIFLIMIEIILAAFRMHIG